MYHAELKGKIPSKLENSEDLLTSNVFSFFKYSPRHIFLRQFLALIDISPTNTELESATFSFWPRYVDGTEPDVVITIGNYYLLFEAKLFANFAEADVLRKSQIDREIDEGFLEAYSISKEFLFVAVTADYHYSKASFANIHAAKKGYIRWINWQTIALLLLDNLELNTNGDKDYGFARDLYLLLDKKKLRGFLPFDRLIKDIPVSPITVFFDAKSAIFCGSFFGFAQALPTIPIVESAPRLFFTHELFSSLPYYLFKQIDFTLGGTQ